MSQPKPPYVPTLAELRITHGGVQAQFDVKVIPTTIKVLHDRVVSGNSDAMYGKAIRFVAVVPTALDRDRFPSLLKDAKCVWLAYGVRS